MPARCLVGLALDPVGEDGLDGPYVQHDLGWSMVKRTAVFNTERGAGLGHFEPDGDGTEDGWNAVKPCRASGYEPCLGHETHVQHIGSTRSSTTLKRIAQMPMWPPTAVMPLRVSQPMCVCCEWAPVSMLYMPSRKR